MTSPYDARNTTLAQLGYADYTAYRASPLWSSIRSRIMSGGRCYVCGLPPEQVHHTSYDEAALLGLDDSGLLPVCHACHEWAHAGNHCVLPPGLATARMRNARKLRLVQKAAMAPPKRRRKPKQKPRGRRLAGTLARSSVAHRADAA